jgi:CO/xanthine dehydrogenase Mo-binding subunit
VEIEYDSRECSYRLIKAATVLDAGKVINPYHARGQVTGGMNMGLGLATREHYVYDQDGRLQNSSLRTYKVLRFGQNPEYVAEFVETPNPDAPYGLRGLAEEAVLGMPPAFANAVTLAAGTEFDTLPVTFESIWTAKNGGAT